MRLTRDSLVLWIGLLTGIAGVLAANANLFPAGWTGYINVASALLAAISGWLKTSPLPGEHD